MFIVLMAGTVASGAAAGADIPYGVGDWSESLGNHRAVVRVDKPAEAASTLKFFDWAYKHGDKTAEDLEYVAMPAVVKTQVEKAWGEVKDASGKPVAYK